MPIALGVVAQAANAVFSQATSGNSAPPRWRVQVHGPDLRLGRTGPCVSATPDLSRRPSQFSSATNERAEPAYVRPGGAADRSRDVRRYDAALRAAGGEPPESHPAMTRNTSAVTAASPAPTVTRKPRRGDHNVPVAGIEGRIQRTCGSAGLQTLAPARQSETTTWVAAIGGRWANVKGSGSLKPPSVKYRASRSGQTDTAGNSRGIDALARTASLNVTVESTPVPKYRGRRVKRSWQTIPKRLTPW